MDDDLNALSRDQLIAEAKRLRSGIRQHRDSIGHELCWHHPALWSLLPEPFDLKPTVPPWPEFIARCAQYRQALEDELVARKPPAR